MVVQGSWQPETGGPVALVALVIAATGGPLRGSPAFTESPAHLEGVDFAGVEVHGASYGPSSASAGSGFS